MVKIKSTDPYGPGFFEEGRPARPATESVSDRTSDQPDTAVTDATEFAASASSELVGSGGEAATEVTDKESTRSTIRLNADIDRDLHRRLRLRVASEGITIADFLRHILQRELS